MPTDLPLPAETVHHILIGQARAIPNAVALEFESRAWTYAELERASRKFGAGLAALGLKPGDRLGLMTPNLPEFVVAFHGALMAGATIVLYNVMLRPNEIEHLIANSGTSFMIAMRDFLPQLSEAERAVGASLKRVVIGAPGAAPARQGDVAYDDVAATCDGGFEPELTPTDRIALLVYTSGTTGKAKGAMLSHYNVLANLAAVRALRPVDEPSRVLCVLPLFHCFGLIAILLATEMRGGTVVLQPRFEAGAVIDALKTKRITTFGGTPTMFFHVLNHPASQGAKFPALIWARSGGAPMPLEIRTAFRQRFGVDILEGYGLTESTVSLSAYPHGMLPKAGSVGAPLPSVEIKIVNDAGEELMIGEPGEIIARGPNIMVGYYNNPEATADALRDGWLYTGDIGYVDDKGYIFVVDRKKDMVIKGGYNIYPREIEEVIYELPEVNMAAVFGIPDLGKGELVQAAVSLKEGQALTPERVMEHLRSKLSKYKLPEKIVILPHLPTGPTGKILKRELRGQWDEIGK